jgi:hypothetical protein
MRGPRSTLTQALGCELADGVHFLRRSRPCGHVG